RVIVAVAGAAAAAQEQALRHPRIKRTTAESADVASAISAPGRLIRTHHERVQIVGPVRIAAPAATAIGGELVAVGDVGGIERPGRGAGSRAVHDALASAPGPAV